MPAYCNTSAHVAPFPVSAPYARIVATLSDMAANALDDVAERLGFIPQGYALDRLALILDCADAISEARE